MLFTPYFGVSRSPEDMRNSLSCNEPSFSCNRLDPLGGISPIGNRVHIISYRKKICAVVITGNSFNPSVGEPKNIRHGFFSLMKRLVDFFYFVAHKIAQNRTNGRKARGAGW